MEGRARPNEEANCHMTGRVKTAIGRLQERCRHEKNPPAKLDNLAGGWERVLISASKTLGEFKSKSRVSRVSSYRHEFNKW